MIYRGLWSDGVSSFSAMRLLVKDMFVKDKSITWPALCVASPGRPMKLILAFADQSTICCLL